MSGSTNEFSSAAYKYAALFYAIATAFLWYVWNAFGSFLALHYLPENPEGYSHLNPHFKVWNLAASGVAAGICLLGLLSIERLRYYILDVGDELTRVSWNDFKETQKSTVIVLGLCVVSAIFLFVCDQVFHRVVNLLLSL